jgi:hypothetical protein
MLPQTRKSSQSSRGALGDRTTSQIANMCSSSFHSTDQDYCYPRVIGYNPAAIMATIEGSSFSTAATDTTEGLTRVMVLHPVACALAFIAFLLAIGAGFCGSLLASMVALLTWIVTLVVMAVDFALFGVIKNHVNSDGTGSNAYYSTGMWTCLAAMITLLIGTVIMFFSCFSARRHRDDPGRSSRTTRRWKA